MKGFRWRIAISLFLIFGSVTRASQIIIDNAVSLRKFYKIKEENLERLKLPPDIAIMDRGYAGLRAHADYLLPRFQEVIFTEALLSKLLGENAGKPMSEDEFYGTDSHGVEMAQVVGSLLPSSHGYLLNGDLAHFPNLLRSLQFSISKKVKVILSAQVTAASGGYDGDPSDGPIKRAFKLATDKGIFVVTAAGNHHLYSFSAPALAADGGSLIFQDVKNYRGKKVPKDHLRFHCGMDETRLKLVLSWHRKDEKEALKDQALDLSVFDASGHEVELVKSELSSPKKGASTSEAELQAYRVYETKEGLDRGDYTISIRRTSGSFDENLDSVRLVFYPPSSDSPSYLVRKQVDFIDATGKEESMTPSDASNVVTIGDTARSVRRGEPYHYSAVGGENLATVKADFLMPRPEILKSDSEDPSLGTSQSSAIFASVLLDMIHEVPGLTHSDLMYWKQYLSSMQPLEGLPLTGWLQSKKAQKMLNLWQQNFVWKLSEFVGVTLGIAGVEVGTPPDLDRDSIYQPLKKYWSATKLYEDGENGNLIVVLPKYGDKILEMMGDHFGMASEIQAMKSPDRLYLVLEGPHQFALKVASGTATSPWPWKIQSGDEPNRYVEVIWPPKHTWRMKYGKESPIWVRPTNRQLKALISRKKPGREKLTEDRAKSLIQEFSRR